VKAGLQPFRIGPDGRVKESLLPFSLKGRFKEHPLHNKFLELRQRVSELRRTLRATLKGRTVKVLQQHAGDWKRYCEWLFRLGRVFLKDLASCTIGHMQGCSSEGGEVGEADDLSYYAHFRCCGSNSDRRPGGI